MKTKFTFLGLVLVVGITANAQSLERSVIGAAGGFSSAGNVSLSWTAGEVIVTTASSGSVILTQGFQQPNPASSSVKPITLQDGFAIYPNPSTGLFQVKVTSRANTDINQLQAIVYDGSGKQVGLKNIDVNQNIGTIDLSYLPSGIYHMSIAAGNNSYGVYKITILN